MNTSMNLQRISVDRLKPAKYNPRKDLKPGDPAYEKIKRSLHEFGYVDPVIWNEVTGNIVGGHQRYKVLTAEGATEIDCVVVHIKNPQEEKALNIALNKAVGEWEPVALADLLNDLKLSGYDVDATGFDAAEVDALFSQVHDKDVKEDDFDVGAELKHRPSAQRKWRGHWRDYTAGAAITADEIIDLIHSVKSGYRKKAIFLLNDSTVKALRKLKDGSGQYLWQPGLKEGQPDKLLSYRLVTSAYMPEVASGAKPVLFGDFSSYWIADRQGRSFQRLNELYAATGQIGFRATQRVDGRLVQSEGLKCLAMKA